MKYLCDGRVFLKTKASSGIKIKIKSLMNISGASSRVSSRHHFTDRLTYEGNSPQAAGNLTHPGLINC